MNLTAPRSDLLVFGFTGRDYKTDASTLNDMKNIREEDVILSQLNSTDNDLLNLFNDSDFISIRTQ